MKYILLFTYLYHLDFVTKLADTCEQTVTAKLDQSRETKSRLFTHI